MKRLDIVLIANREFKKLDKEMINNSLTHTHTLIGANHQSDNHREKDPLVDNDLRHLYFHESLSHNKLQSMISISI